MKKFSDFKIERDTEIPFVGTSIEAAQLVDREITVLDYKIKPSKFPEKGNDKCLHMQLAIGEVKYVCFTIAKGLMADIQKIPNPEGFPFTTTIKKIDRRLIFQ